MMKKSRTGSSMGQLPGAPEITTASPPKPMLAREGSAAASSLAHSVDLTRSMLRRKSSVDVINSQTDAWQSGWRTELPPDAGAKTAGEPPAVYVARPKRSIFHQGIGDGDAVTETVVGQTEEQSTLRATANLMERQREAQMKNKETSERARFFAAMPGMEDEHSPFKGNLVRSFNEAPDAWTVTIKKNARMVPKRKPAKWDDTQLNVMAPLDLRGTSGVRELIKESEHMDKVNTLEMSIAELRKQAFAGVKQVQQVSGASDHFIPDKVDGDEGEAEQLEESDMVKSVNAMAEDVIEKTTYELFGGEAPSAQIRRIVPKEIESVALVVGPPGSGKTTYGRLLCPDYGYTYIDYDEVVRAELLKKSNDGKAALRAIREEIPIEPDVAIRILLHSFQQSGARKFFVEGFPQSTGQAMRLQSALKVSWVMHLDIPVTEGLARLRAKNKVATLKKRDYDETLVRRATMYTHHTEATLEYYKEVSKTKVFRVDGTLTTLQVKRQVGRYFREAARAKMMQDLKKPEEEVDAKKSLIIQVDTSDSGGPTEKSRLDPRPNKAKPIPINELAKEGLNKNLTNATPRPDYSEVWRLGVYTDGLSFQEIMETLVGRLEVGLAKKNESDHLMRVRNMAGQQSDVDAIAEKIRGNEDELTPMAITLQRFMRGWFARRKLKAWKAKLESRNVAIMRRLIEQGVTKEMLDMAVYIGLDPLQYPNLMWIAQEALVADLPQGWKAVGKDDGTVIFVNDAKNIQTVEDPVALMYRELVVGTINIAATIIQKIVRSYLAKKYWHMHKIAVTKRRRNEAREREMMHIEELSSILLSAEARREESERILMGQAEADTRAVLNKGATMIQALYRGHRGRKFAAQYQYRPQAILITAHWRRHAALMRVEHIQHTNAALCIQKAWRGAYGRSLATIVRAAKFIQAIFRGYLARRYVVNERGLVEMVKNRYALRIQCAWRCSVARSEVAQKKRAVRGWKTSRKKILLYGRYMKQMADFREMRNNKAATIQAAWRGHTTRRNLKKKVVNSFFRKVNHYAAIIRANFLGMTLRGHIEEVIRDLRQHKMARRIQAVYRGFSVRRNNKHKMRLHRLLLRIQKCWRAHHAERVQMKNDANDEMEPYHYAATQMQRLGRMILARNIVERKKRVRKRWGVSAKHVAMYSNYMKKFMSKRDRKRYALILFRAIVRVVMFKVKVNRMRRHKAARKIQKAGRRMLGARIKEMWWAAYRIQPYVRQFLKERRLVYSKYSIVIQHGVRRYLGRLHFEKRKQLVSAIRIQSVWRGCRGRWRSNMVRFVVMIQSWWRSCLSMKRRQYNLILASFATKIQAWFRGNKGRKQVKDIYHKIMRQRAAIKIQRLWRGHTDRVFCKDQLEWYEMHKASRVIQKAWRRYLFMSAQLRMKVEWRRRHELKCITVLQAVFRGYVDRKEYKKIRIACLRLQTFIRRRALNKAYQSVWRDSMRQRAAVHNRLVVHRWYGKKHLQKVVGRTHNKEEVAAMIIQWYVRDWLTRKKELEVRSGLKKGVQGALRMADWTNNMVNVNFKIHRNRIMQGYKVSSQDTKVGAFDFFKVVNALGATLPQYYNNDGQEAVPKAAPVSSGRKTPPSALKHSECNDTVSTITSAKNTSDGKPSEPENPHYIKKVQLDVSGASAGTVSTLNLDSTGNIEEFAPVQEEPSVLSQASVASHRPPAEERPERVGYDDDARWKSIRVETALKPIHQVVRRDEDAVEAFYPEPRTQVTQAPVERPDIVGDRIRFGNENRVHQVMSFSGSDEGSPGEGEGPNPRTLDRLSIIRPKGNPSSQAHQHVTFDGATGRRGVIGGLGGQRQRPKSAGPAGGRGKDVPQVAYHHRNGSRELANRTNEHIYVVPADHHNPKQTKRFGMVEEKRNVAFGRTLPGTGKTSGRPKSAGLAKTAPVGTKPRKVKAAGGVLKQVQKGWTEGQGGFDWKSKNVKADEDLPPVRPKKMAPPVDEVAELLSAGDSIGESIGQPSGDEQPLSPGVPPPLSTAPAPPALRSRLKHPGNFHLFSSKRYMAFSSKGMDG